MLENEGHWLKLMRNAIVPTDANICLRISGGEILCTVTKDVNKEVELKVTCRIGDQQSNQTNSKKDSTTDDHLNEHTGRAIRCNRKASPVGMLNYSTEETLSLREGMTSKDEEIKMRESPEEKIENSAGSDAEEARDNSTTHETTSGGNKPSEGIKSKSSDESPSIVRKNSELNQKHPQDENGAYKCPLCNFCSTERRAYEKHVQSHRSSSLKRGTSHMTNSQSFCEACSIQFMSVDTYQVHKKYYCKSRHDREEPPLSPSAPEPAPVGVSGAFKPSADTVILRGGAVNGTGAPSLIQPQAIYAAISTNPLILLPCSLVNGEGLVAQNGVIATGGPGIVLQTGIACPTIVEKPPSTMKVKEESLPSRKTSHPIMTFNTDPSEKLLSGSSSIRKRKMSEGDVLNLKKTFTAESVHEVSERDSKSPADDQDTPLDLSLKRKKTSSMPCKRKISSTASVECSSPVPSGDSSSSPRSILQTSVIAASPSSSYSNDSLHCYSSQGSVLIMKPSQTQIERVSPSPPVLQADGSIDKSVLPPGMPPPKLLKQGNNVCEECNIVFYKYDNYLAHKKHYCAYRRQQLSALAAAAAAAAAASASGPEQSSDDNNSNHSGVNESVQGYPIDESNKSVLRRVETGEQFRPVITKPSQSAFVCDSCGVKYSSLDTLNAHQTYYCSKRADSAMSKFVKSRSENSGSPNGVEPPFSGPEEWKCNYCEATCSSYETIRRHLLTHSELRGFRCLLCGYKGNTLRGMRTHACEHLNESTTSIEEFVSSTVISENGALPANHRTVDFSDEDSNQSRGHKNFKRERTSSENHRANPYKYEEKITTERSDSNEMSRSPNTNDSVYKNRDSSVKAEVRDSSPEGSGGSHQETVNPLAFCDVVIKTENEQTSSGDESRDGPTKAYIKSEPEPDPDSDSDGRELMLSESPPVQPISVIRCASDKDTFQESKLSKKKGKSQTKATELKYCKSCDISFYHMSNFIAHKKYYCSRPVPNRLQETTTVQ